MRFGIMDMQLGALIPPGLSPQTAAEYLATFDQAQLVAGLADQGFSLVELSGDLVLFFPDTFSPASVTRLNALKAGRGLSYTVHLPLWSVELASPLPSVRQGGLAAMIDIIKATQPLSPEMYVLHATGPLAAEFYQMDLPGMARSLILQQFAYLAEQSVETILAETGLPSRRLALETIEFPLEFVLATADALDTSICLDTGHLLSGFAGPVDFFDALDRCLPRLGEVHLHDAPRQGGPEGKFMLGLDHQALGRGDLDVAGLLDRLSSAGYAGPIIMELTVQEAAESLGLMRRLRPHLVDR